MRIRREGEKGKEKKGRRRREEEEKEREEKKKKVLFQGLNVLSDGNESLTCFRVSPLAKTICANLRTQMQRQSWALEPGQVAASLFSRELENDEKARIAAKIWSLKPSPLLDSSTLLQRGKPSLPQLSSSKTLPDFVTERSILFLELFCPGYDQWLSKNPPWNGIPEYDEAEKIVRSIVPVNDPAERMCGFAKRFRVRT